MKVGVKAREVDPVDTKPKSLRVSLVLDPETAQNLVSLAEREGQPVPEMVRTLLVGSLSAYPSWGINAADRKRAYGHQQHLIMKNLIAWFSEQKWILEQQLAAEERAHAHSP